MRLMFLTKSIVRAVKKVSSARKPYLLAFLIAVVGSAFASSDAKAQSFSSQIAAASDVCAKFVTTSTVDFSPLQKKGWSVSKKRKQYTAILKLGDNIHAVYLSTKKRSSAYGCGVSIRSMKQSVDNSVIIRKAFLAWAKKRKIVPAGRLKFHEIMLSKDGPMLVRGTRETFHMRQTAGYGFKPMPKR